MEASRSLLPKDPELATLKVKGEIQPLTVKLSKIQYMILRQYSLNKEENREETMTTFKPPVFIEENDDDDEFFDAADPYEDIMNENIKIPYNKVHLQAIFSITSLNLIIMDETDDNEILTLSAKDLSLSVLKEEAKRTLRLRLGYILLKDWIGKREIIQSNQDTSDLIFFELLKYHENHPDYYDQQFHTNIGLSVSNLHLNYYEGNT